MPFFFLYNNAVQKSNKINALLSKETPQLQLNSNK